MTVRELNDKLQAIDIDKMVRDSVIQNQSKLVVMNRRQMEVGINAEGDTIGYYSSKNYANYKKAIGSKAPFRVPDLKLTGQFHSGVFLDVDDQEYNFWSSDEKAGMLAEKYKKIFGLTKENQELAKEFNTRSFGQLLKQASGL